MMLLTLACSVSGDDSATTALDGAVDARLEEGTDYPAPGADDVLWYTPELVIQPGEDIMYCLFGTYTGDDIGIHSFDTYQSEIGHHIVLMGTSASELDFADGEVIDCTATNSLPMADLEPLILPTGGSVGVGGTTLPDGYAVKLRHGQRWVIQGHWLNTTTEPQRVRDVAVMNTLAVDAVAEWAAPMVMNHQGFELAPHEETHVSFDCTFEQDYSVLYFLGHMHEYGTHFSLDQLDATGEPTSIYETDWDASYRDLPPVNAYAPGEFLLPAGTTMRTQCTWNNTTDDAIVFPHEMCDAVAMVYPALTSDICSD